MVCSFVMLYLLHGHGLSLSAERAVRPSRPSCPPDGVLPSGGQKRKTWPHCASLGARRSSAATCWPTCRDDRGG